MKKMMLICALLVSSASFAKNKVVYGDDNRVDVYDSDNAMFVELSKSTAAMILKSKLVSSEDDYNVIGSTLVSRGICKSERFSNQMSAANCSGFLVGEDLLVTAGHCITDQVKCDSYNWVFDYKVESQDQFEVKVDKNNVYGCKEIISRSLDFSTQDDYALIRLDRKVLDRRVLDYRTSGSPQVGDELVVIGHPSGLPTKIADGANIRELNDMFFTANLDTYGGNSGSAVFNASTGVVEGILVRGATDYVYNRFKRCRVTNVLGNNEGRGEDVTYITNVDQL